MANQTMIKLLSPARYFPIEKGLYEVAPGLRRLGTSLGNGERDGLVFQIDSEFNRYRENKLACRQERLGKYYCTSNYPDEVSQAVNQFLIERLTNEHPSHFKSNSCVNKMTLECKLTGERLEFDSKFQLMNKNTIYQSGLDALCSQVQEDVAVVTRDFNKDWLSAAHVCSPSQWSPEDKIGKSFFDVHAPVPGIEKMNRAATSLVDAMINKGPYVRFVWGFKTNDRLNRHPIPAPGIDLEEWHGRAFDPNHKFSPFFLRVERQVTWGLPQVHSAIFAIRTYFIDGNEIQKNPKERDLLKAGLLSMTPESRVHKGVAKSFDQIIAWLSD